MFRFYTAVTLAVLLKCYTFSPICDVCFYIVYQQYTFLYCLDQLAKSTDTKNRSICLAEASCLANKLAGAKLRKCLDKSPIFLFSLDRLHPREK